MLLIPYSRSNPIIYLNPSPLDDAKVFLLPRSSLLPAQIEASVVREMSPPSVFDRLGRMSTFPLSFTRQVPNRGAVNGLAAVHTDGLSGPQPPSSHVATAEASKILQCFRETCGCSFSGVDSWREHNKDCHVQTLRYQCVFARCGERFSSASSDAFIRHQKMHRAWVCKRAECFLQFDRRDKALKHATKDHRFEAPGDFVKEIWFATSLKHKKGVRYQPGTDLELANFLEELESTTLRKINRLPVLNTGYPGCFKGIEPKGNTIQVSLPSAVFTCVADQLNTMNNLLDNPSLVPSEPESQRLQQALDMVQEKLRLAESRRLTAGGWNGKFMFDALDPSLIPPTTNFQGDFPEATYPQHQKLLSPPLSSVISPSGERAQYYHWGIDSQSEDDSDEDLEVSETRPIEGEEPRQDMNIEKSEQIRYFEAMQKCCVEAAFGFYQRHKSHLDAINDRSSKPLCQTARKGPIENPTDLSLPHWTHLLRRICDARGLHKGMVSRVESFNGDISPVDELQHAFKKEKVKSDRDLLALIQLTRNFCWQLKDWDRCKQLDDLYGLVDKSIRQVKRNDSQASRKHRPKLRKERILENGIIKSVNRQSATWPRAIPDEGGTTIA